MPEDSVRLELTGAGKPKRRFQRITFIGIILLSLLFFLLLIFPHRQGQQANSYETASAFLGEVVMRVFATGNLQPTIQVDVGSELSGTVVEILAVENDRVEKGQVLARLDTAKLEDQVVKSKAALKAAQAAVTVSKATTKEARSAYERLQKLWEASKGRVPSKNELEQAEATFDRAVANESSADASVAQAEAALRSDGTNVAKAVITSPINGIVLHRYIEPGQTVAATLQAPVLFVIAQDLAKMELQVDIDEADVGQVRAGQNAEFLVDAYPGRQYPATIKRVRYGSETVNGVVTYRGILEVENGDFSLRPGMTANASIIIAHKKNVLVVPNAALRFTPVAVAEDNPKGGILSYIIPHPPMEDAPKVAGIVSQGDFHTVWTLISERPKSVHVTTGLSDGKITEIADGDLKPGDKVITDSIVGR